MALTTASQTAIPAGALLTMEASGEIPSYVFATNFRENLITQMLVQGFDVDTCELSVGTGITSKGWRATIKARYAASTNVSSAIAAFRTAAEKAGSFRPTVTIPSYGQPAQPELKAGMVEKLLATLAESAGKIVGAVGTAAQGAAQVPGAVTKIPTLLVVGIVAIAALVAFSPAGKAAARRL